jgi:quinol monooxygenase YgiN
MSRYALFGKFTAAPGQRDELRDLLLDAAGLVADAPGYETWIVHTSPDDPDGVWVYESWCSEADHDASLTDERVRAIISRAMPLIAGISDQVKLVPAD